MSEQEMIARIIHDEMEGDDDSGGGAYMRAARRILTTLASRTPEGMVMVPREPTPEMVATVVQQVGDPTPEQWAIAERAVMGICGPNMQGEAVAAELIRDYQAMLSAAPTPSGAE